MLLLAKCFRKFSSNFYNFVETLSKFARAVFLQTSIKFLQMFRQCFPNNCYKLFLQSQQNFSLHFHNYFNSLRNFPKILCKNSFFFRHSSATTFFYFTKITRHYFTKHKIFEKSDGVTRTFSISSLKFLLKLASHYEKLLNTS